MNQVTKKGIAYINPNHQSVNSVIKGVTTPIIDLHGMHGNWSAHSDYVRIGTVELTITLDNAAVNHQEMADEVISGTTLELQEKLEALLAMVRRNIKGALLEVAMSDAETVINKARGES